MRIQFGYDKKQVLDALRNYFFSRPEIRVLAIVINVFAIGSAVLFYMKFIQPLSFLVFSLLWFFLWMAMRLVLPGYIYRKSATFRDQFTLSLEEDGITLHNERGVQYWTWSQITQFRESLYFFHLYFNSRSFFLIPKDAFADLLAQQSARNLIRSRVPVH